MEVNCPIWGKLLTLTGRSDREAMCERGKETEGRNREDKIESFPLFLRYSILLRTGYERVVSVSVHSNTVASVLCCSFELLKFMQYLTSRLRGIKNKRNCILIYG